MQNSWTSEETDPRVLSLNESLVHVDRDAAFLSQFKRTVRMVVRRVGTRISELSLDN